MAVHRRELETYVIGEEVEAHLAFVYDVVFFSRETTKLMKALHNILTEFTEFSTLEVKKIDKLKISLLQNKR